MAALKQELATFTHGKLVAPPDSADGTGPNKYGVCCDRGKEQCDCDGPVWEDEEEA